MPALDAKSFRTALIRVAGKNGFFTNSKSESGLAFPEAKITGTSRERILDGLGKAQSVAVGHLNVADDQIHAAIKFAKMDPMTMDSKARNATDYIAAAPKEVQARLK